MNNNFSWDTFYGCTWTWWDNLNGWSSVSITPIWTAGNPWLSCLDIKTQNSSAANDIYRIDPDGLGWNGMFEVYCDMVTDGGWWMLVMNLDTSDGNIQHYNSSFWTSNIANVWSNISSLTSDYKHKDAFVVWWNKFC